LFKSPLIYFGKGAIGRIANLKGERALIVTDKKIRALGFLSELEKHLKGKFSEIKTFDEVEPEPKDSTVSSCAEIAAAFKPDSFIGLGGGSPIDVAKGAFLLYERPDVKLATVSPLVNYGLRKKARLAAIPTTSGTGSEVSVGLAVTDSKSGRKLTLTSFELVPDVAILDPQLAFKMPPKLRADTGLDVLVHAVESLLTKMSNQFTSASAIKAIQTVFRYLGQSYKTGNEIAMEEMHYAASLAGSAMSYSGLGIAHSLGHAVGSAFHLPHGQAVGWALPYTIEYCSKTAKDKYLELLRDIGVEGATQENSAQKLLTAVKGLMTEIKEPTSIKDLEIDEGEFRSKIPTMAGFAAGDLCTFTSPRVPTTKEYTTILEYMAKDKPIDF